MDDKFNKILSQEIKKNNIKTTIYIIDKLLGDKQNNECIKNNCILLLKGYKILVINNFNEGTNNETFREDFIDDLDSEAKKFEYRQEIGRKREWENLIESVPKSELIEYGFEKYKFKENQGKERRVGEFLISLITGSINDIKSIKIELPTTDLEKVKQNIRIFDSKQSKFIFSEEDEKIIRIQGLAGTEKTELLLNKLKELYSKKEEYKIAFTCHNKVLSSELRKCVPEFFNFMKVDRQIEWDKNLWIFNGWGLRNNPNSGLYSYICNFYSGNFQSFSPGGDTFDTLCLNLLNEIKEKQVSNELNYCFDYLFVDESQDFGDNFVELCKYITKSIVYIAGDIFQSIFETLDTTKKVNYILDKCYRTDPKTLMLAHAIGMGLCAKKKN